jgi:hypothetical protein
MEHPATRGSQISTYTSRNLINIDTPIGLCNPLYLVLRMMLISLDIDLAAAVNMEDLTFPIGHPRLW